ncbi:MAG: hypothetical protein ABI360_09680 [Allobranchiibius sp.]
MSDLTLALAGPIRHGVRLHALALARSTPRLQRVNIEDGPLPPGPVHLHFTDRIFGRDALDAAAALTGLVGRRPMSVTLHDLPQPSDGGSFERRQQGYAQVVAAARGVQVSSLHERRLLFDLWEVAGSGAMPPVDVVPLPVDRPTQWGARAEAERDVAVLGFVYPGKGHLEPLRAMSDLPPAVPLVALGAASDGHDDLLVELAAAARSQDRSFECTGYLTDADLNARIGRAGVPVSAHTHISASGSINRWIGGGRRPVVTPGRYISELAERAPWALTVAADLPAAIAAALADPASTWITESVWDCVALPDTAAAAAMQLAAIEALG